MREKFLVIAIVLLFGAIGVVSAGYDTEIYDAHTATADYRTDLDGGDAVALDGAGVAAITTITVNGSPTVTVSARLSASGATCEITFMRGYDDGSTWHTHGIQQSTATATSYTEGGDYVAGDLFFDSGGSPNAKVLAADPSSGTVDLHVTRTTQ